MPDVLGLVAPLVQASQQTQPVLAPSTLVEIFGVAALIVFAFSVLVCGFLTKHMNNIAEASYAKAFLATFLKNLISLTGFFLFGLYLDAPVIVALGIAYSLIPVTVYKIVFSCMWREAFLIWFVTLVAEMVVAFVLFFVGLVNLAPYVQRA